MKLLKKFKSFITIFLLILSTSATAGEGPERIVSLAPSITESLYYLGLEKELIAVTSYCNYPPEAKTKKIIGNLTNPNVEEIYSLSPDLVLTVEGVNRLQTIEKLRSLGLNIVVLNESDNFQDILNNFTRLGKLVDKEKRAEEIVKQVETKVKSITEKIKDLPSVKVFWEVGAKPLFTVSSKSFANEFITYSGGTNIFTDASAKYPLVSREEVLKRNPQVIILVTMGNVTKREKIYWEGFKDLDAARFNKIHIVNADNVCRPTPMAFLTGLEEVAKLIHPENFEKDERL